MFYAAAGSQEEKQIKALPSDRRKNRKMKQILIIFNVHHCLVIMLTSSKISYSRINN
jgi:hypothetical protein